MMIYQVTFGSRGFSHKQWIWILPFSCARCPISRICSIPAVPSCYPALPTASPSSSGRGSFAWFLLLWQLSFIFNICLHLGNIDLCSFKIIYHTKQINNNNKKKRICSGNFFVHCFQKELELGVSVLVEGVKLENPQKNSKSRDKNQ